MIQTAQTFLTAEEVAELLHCDPCTVENLLKRGDLPGLKLGRGWIIPFEALYQRVNQMALEEAEKRRNDRNSARPLAVLVSPSERKTGRRREPPKLPSLE